MDVQPARTMRNLPDTLSSLMGFNKHLTPSWIESVSHIIDGLSPTKPQMKVMVEKDENISDDNTESEAKVQKIQDELVSLNAQLKQITLQRREALNNYLDLKGLSFVPEFSVCENSFIFGFVSFNKDNRCHYMLIDMSLSHRKYKGVLPYKAFSS
jgi:hypothetical protein